MKFYVNKFYDDSVKKVAYENSLIGLFEQCKTDGRGSFCGYYGSEFYLNTRLIAYYTAETKGCYTPEKRIGDIVVCDEPKRYDEVLIGSHMWTKVIEADSLEEAIQKFLRFEWRQWTCDIDEI